jgi:hypothetical protein
MDATDKNLKIPGKSHCEIWIYSVHDRDVRIPESSKGKASLYSKEDHFVIPRSE